VLVKVERAASYNRQESVLKTARLEKNETRLEIIGRFAPGGWFRSSLVPSRLGPVRLYLHNWMRDSAGVGVGDQVQVTLRLDSAPREIPLPAMLNEALEANPEAKAAWEALALSRRREILSYLNFLKTTESLKRNVFKTIQQLLTGKDRPGR
jgi:hypothetical protein